ncbi:protease modulator HflC [Marinicrinis sediminis]|uniref:Protein HflC n=1 Tax=Marinicrinis sediminis TaxID=1652465 RepID=A0ABW5REC9_9BACL
MKKSWIGVLIGAVIVLILFFSSVFIVKEGEIKVVLQFGEVQDIRDTPGIQFKIPFIQSVSALPKYQKIYDSEPTSILTKDKKPIIVDNYTIWRIRDPQKFLQTLQTVESAEGRIGDAVYNTVRRKLSEIEYGNIISEDTARGNLNVEVTKEVATILERDGYGIEITDVRIKRTDLPETNKQSVYNRMISDRKAIAARYLSEGDEESRKITSNADRQAKEIIAQAQADSKQIISEGEQEAAKIYNQSYGKDPEFYSLYRTLESYGTTLNGDPIIMLPINSPYARILMGEE